jgi:hypothetical protein
LNPVTPVVTVSHEPTARSRSREAASFDASVRSARWRTPASGTDA